MDDINVHITRKGMTRTFEASVRKLEQCFSSVDGVTEPRTIALIGKPRTGKTRAIDDALIIAGRKSQQANGLQSIMLTK